MTRTRYFSLNFMFMDLAANVAKVNKHIAKIDGAPIFGTLWTCMDSRYIHAQALTLTKSHEERLGPLMGISKSIKLYGHPDPPIAFSDDLIKVSHVHWTSITSLNWIWCRIKL